MPQARKWADEFEEGIKAYGFSTEQIYRYKDIDENIMSRATCKGARDKIKKNAREGRRTLLLCFYAGHGATTKYNRSVVLLNSN